MVIAQLAKEEVLVSCRHELGLPESSSGKIDTVFLAFLIRRCAAIYSPCSKNSLKSVVLDTLQYIYDGNEDLDLLIDSSIENLIVGGDILELSDVFSNEQSIKGTWIFPGLPGFIARPSGSIFFFGIAKDRDTLLPEYLVSRIIYDRFTRTIIQEPQEELAEVLRGSGLQEFSVDAWLKTPKQRTAHDLCKPYITNLKLQPSAGDCPELKILESDASITTYRYSWITSQDKTGFFIARRPQAYGSDLWCFVELEHGRLLRLLDIPLGSSRWRACDIAWHLQLALDYMAGRPPRYRRTRITSGVCFDFFSPLPVWAQRRLIVFGESTESKTALFSFTLPNNEAKYEELFLQERLWMSPTEDSN